MDYGSPMMRRLNKNGGSGFKFPKKGRIRIAFVAILIIVGLKKGTSYFEVREQERFDEFSVPEKQKSEKKDTLNIEQIRKIIQNSSLSLELGVDTLENNGNNFLFHYSIDTSLQKLGMKLMKRYSPLYGAAVVIQPVSGRVLAMVSFTADSVKDMGSDLYLKSLFPAASIYKTITAAAAIEEAKLSSKSLLKQVGRNHTLYMFQLEEKLENYRELSLEEAYARSINPVFARLGIYKLKHGDLVEYGRRFGFDQKIPFELPVEISDVKSPDSMFAVAELASGFNRQTTLSPLLGALIASAVSEDGKMPMPILVDSVMREDTCFYKAEGKTWKNPVKKSTSHELRELMCSVSRYGTARKSFRYIRKTSSFKSFQYGGKTGSVNKDNLGKIDWFIGFARNPSNPDERLAAGVVTIHGEYWTVHSSYIAAELFRNYLRTLQKERQRIEKEKNTTVSIDSITKQVNVTKDYD